jgi:hypothetical protein
MSSRDQYIRSVAFGFKSNEVRMDNRASITLWKALRYLRKEARILQTLPISFGDLSIPLFINPLLIERFLQRKYSWLVV